jgi:hypothetical protein
VVRHNDKIVSNLTLKNQLVLVKIRLDIPFACLAILFNLSSSSGVGFWFNDTTVDSRGPTILVILVTI